MRSLRMLRGSLLSTALLGACATGAGSGEVAPAPSTEAIKARVKELNDKVAKVTQQCTGAGEADRAGGLFEVSADAGGKLSARGVWWKATPQTEACLLGAINQATISALGGPTVAMVWQVLAPGASQAEPPPLPPDAMSEFSATQGRLQVEVEACAQRHLPPEFGADVEVAFYLVAGGKVVAPTVISSTAKDGNYETCVRGVVGGGTFPDPHYDGPYPAKLSFHVGRLDHV